MDIDVVIRNIETGVQRFFTSAETLAKFLEGEVKGLWTGHEHLGLLLITPAQAQLQAENQAAVASTSAANAQAIAETNDQNILQARRALTDSAGANDAAAAPESTAPESDAPQTQATASEQSSAPAA
ncbi:hypothetical protein GALL_153200 [mine drainage metagenome]|uniref:Uncharacterized protein n=1 Tax=mine drainage metagenome TaxID=410659 RepID=A0A1J5SRA0_9ZZZZ